MVTVWSGLNGTEAPDRNFSVTFVFVTVWLGLVVLSVVFGDVFRAFNPWRAIARVVGGVFKLVAGPVGAAAARLPRAARALAGRDRARRLRLARARLRRRAAFRPSASPRTRSRSRRSSTRAYTFVAMALFGTEKWLERGETFSVYFRMFSTLSPLRGPRRRLGVRRALAGADAAGSPRRPGSVALVLVTIGGDDLRRRRARARWPSPIRDGRGLVRRHRPRPGRRAARHQLDLPGARPRLRRRPLLGRDLRHAHGAHATLSTRELGRLFAHAFIPIALAYLVAHYFSLVVFQEQAQFTLPALRPARATAPTSSAPRAAGSTTALISANAIWYVQVARAGGRPRDRARPRPRPGAARSTATRGSPPARSTGCWR